MSYILQHRDTSGEQICLNKINNKEDKSFSKNKSYPSIEICGRLKIQRFKSKLQPSNLIMKDCRYNQNNWKVLDRACT